MMNRIAKTAFFTAFCLLSSGCATRMTVKAGLSENIKDFYSIYPSIEIDIAAVTEEEAEDLKKTDVDGYFAVGNAKRERLTPYTMTFSAEQTKPQTMKYNVYNWNKWLDKKPEKIAVIVNMPRAAAEGEKGKDARVLIMDMSSGFMHHKELYVEAKPGSIVRIKNEPTDPEQKRRETEKIRKKEEEKAAKREREAKKREMKEKRAAEKEATKEKKAALKREADKKKAEDKKMAQKRNAARKKAAEKNKAAAKKSTSENKGQ
ncbi:MAG: hypothetical protein IJ846_01640 [Alphaproteobacteria bacterium]|nr:hypothetical protein [Alphaproteobacteria bacterium]